jgi:hypothetical protein
MSEAYAPLRDCNVTRITFPAIVAGMENGFVADRLNFVDTSFGETFLGKSRGPPRRQTPRYVNSVDLSVRTSKQNGGGEAAANCRKTGATRREIRPRKRRPGGSSRAGPDRLRSGPGNRRRQDHDGAYDILLFRSSPELIKIFGMSQLKQVMQKGTQLMPSNAKIKTRRRRGDQARDRTPSNACAMKIPAPTRPITAVRTSNIANILCAQHVNKTTCRPAQSKGFRETFAQWTRTADFAQHMCQYRSRCGSWRDAIATFHSPSRSPPQFCHGPVAVSLQLSAESGGRIVA